ncbi:hypothetical protein ACW9I4_02305 [Pseudomonas sp. SDT2931_S440]
MLSASALVLECHWHEEKARVQSLNDFIVFGVMAVWSFSSGGLLSAYGWNTVLCAVGFVFTAGVGCRRAGTDCPEVHGRSV